MRWITPDNMPFPMPLDIKIGDKTERILLSTKEKKLKIPENTPIIFDPEKWVLYEPRRLQESAQLISLKKYNEALKSLDKILFIAPDNEKAVKLQSIVNYAIRNPEKLKGNFFNQYLVNYTSELNRRYNFSREEDNFYMTTNRGKYQIYPISDTTFVFTDFEAQVSFGTGTMHFEMGSITVNADVQTE